MGLVSMTGGQETLSRPLQTRHGDSRHTLALQELGWRDGYRAISSMRTT